MEPISILAAGMVTGVGFNAPASCAAIRCAIDSFSETRFIDKRGEWIIGSQVPLGQPWRGVQKLVHMVVPAIRECLVHTRDAQPEMVPLLLCVAEKERPGRLHGLDTQLFREIQRELGVRFHPNSTVIAKGRVAGAVAMGTARRLILQGNSSYCLIAGVDSFLIAATLSDYERKSRLLTSENSNGFIPGEAGTAILVGLPADAGTQTLACFGIGSGQERATIESELPLRAEGLVQAITSAFADAKRTYEDVDYRITDANGEQYWFKEAALAMMRTLRVRKKRFSLRHIADCIGEVGAAAVPCALGVALAAARGNHTPRTGVLCHFGSDCGERVAMVLGHIEGVQG